MVTFIVCFACTLIGLMSPLYGIGHFRRWAIRIFIAVQSDEAVILLGRGGFECGPREVPVSGQRTAIPAAVPAPTRGESPCAMESCDLGYVRQGKLRLPYVISDAIG